MPIHKKQPWEEYPVLAHLEGAARERMESRRRHRNVRYFLFCLQTAVEKGEPLKDPIPGFVEFWLKEEPKYAVDPNQRKGPVPENKRKSVALLGGFAQFAKVWDVDPDLYVYIRHASIWQEWNATLARVVPVLGE